MSEPLGYVPEGGGSDDDGDRMEARAQRLSRLWRETGTRPIDILQALQQLSSEGWSNVDVTRIAKRASWLMEQGAA